MAGGGTGSLVAKDFLVGFLCSAAVVSYWRGTWVLFDVYLYPDDLRTSAWASLAIGGVLFLLLVAAAHIVPVSSLFGAPTTTATATTTTTTTTMAAGKGDHEEQAPSLPPPPQLPAGGTGPLIAFHGLVRLWIYAAGFASVASWRGVWYLWDAYVLEGDRETSAWVSHAVGVAALLVVGKLASIIAPPCLMVNDGPSPPFGIVLWSGLGGTAEPAQTPPAPTPGREANGSGADTAVCVASV